LASNKSSGVTASRIALLSTSHLSHLDNLLQLVLFIPSHVIVLCPVSNSQSREMFFYGVSESSFASLIYRFTITVFVVQSSDIFVFLENHLSTFNLMLLLHHILRPLTYYIFVWHFITIQFYKRFQPCVAGTSFGTGFVSFGKS
jgi:hypothetical protein